MIPSNIKREHIIRAIEEVIFTGIPDHREARHYFIEYNGKHYPAKYIVSLANSYVNKILLPYYTFNGGNETNDFLKSLNFTVTS